MRPRPFTLFLALALAVALALAAAACGGREGAGGTPAQTGAPPAETDAPPADPDAVLVDVRAGVGGFVPVELAIENQPEFRLYGDGTVVVRGPEQGPLGLPQTYRLSEEGTALVLDAAAQAGLLAEAPDYGMPPVTDVGSTTVALDVDGAAVVHSAYALGFEDPGVDGLTAAQRDARAALAGFVELVTGLAESRPDLLETDLAPYTPEAVDVHVWPAPDGAPKATALDWPLATPPGSLPESDGLAGSRCTTVRGAELEALEQALDGAASPVTWLSGKRLWSGAFHVVLPGETGCTAAP